MLSSSVLVLNRSYIPVNITTVKRAFVLFYQGLAKAVDGQFETFDFPSWSELAVAADHETVGLVGRMVRVPRVILLTFYDRVPRRHVPKGPDVSARAFLKPGQFLFGQRCRRVDSL